MVPLEPLSRYVYFSMRWMRRDPRLVVLAVFHELLALVFIAGAIIARPLLSTATPANVDEIIVPRIPDLHVLGTAVAAMLAFVLLRAFTMTALSERHRQHLAPAATRLRRRQRFGTIVSLQLVESAFVLSTGLVIVPIAARIAAYAHANATASLLGLFGFSTFLLAFNYHQIRLFALIGGGWATWRGEFAVGVVGASIGTPIHSWPLWRTLSASWGIVSSALVTLWTLGLLFGTERATSPWTLGLLIGTGVLVACVYAFLNAWLLNTLIALVGHQIGDLSTQQISTPAAGVKHLFSSSREPQIDQATIPSSPRGLFRGSSHDVAIPTFAEILAEGRQQAPVQTSNGPAPGTRAVSTPPAPDDTWVFEAENSSVRANAASAGGANEVGLQFHGTDASNASNARDEATTQPAVNELLGPEVGPDAEGRVGMERLENSLLPALVRTSSGDAELRYRGYRPKQSR